MGFWARLKEKIAVGEKKKSTFVAESAQSPFCMQSKWLPQVEEPRFCNDENHWRDAREVEEARLESVYTPKGYPGFESPSLRDVNETNRKQIEIILSNSIH